MKRNQMVTTTRRSSTDRKDTTIIFQKQLDSPVSCQRYQIQKKHYNRWNDWHKFFQGSDHNTLQ